LEQNKKTIKLTSKNSKNNKIKINKKHQTNKNDKQNK